MSRTSGARPSDAPGTDERSWAAALARRRTAETVAALRALGAQGLQGEVIRLGLPDSGLADREEVLLP